MPTSPGVDVRPEREVDVLRQSIRLMRRRLPRNWSIQLRDSFPAGDVRGEAVADLRGPDSTSVALVLEAKRSIVTAHLPAIVEGLRRSVPTVRTQGDPAVPMVLARYLGSGARAWLERNDVSYADATGNIDLRVDRPAIFLRDRGADRDPWRGPGRPRGTLVGPPAARVVRALVDYAPPLTVPALIARSGASTGAAYRVVRFLEEEALLTREANGPIRTVNWRRILEQWSQDYGFQRSNTVAGYLEPRGVDTLMDRLSRSTEIRYAVTGSTAVRQLAPYAPARLAMIYVDDIHAVADQLALRPVDTGANVLLAAGDHDVVFERTTVDKGLTLVAPAQAAADLLTGPGRAPAEAQELLDWMETHEGEWRQ